MAHEIDTPQKAFEHLWRLEKIGVHEGMAGIELLGEISLHGPTLLELAVEGLKRDLTAIKKAKASIDTDTGRDTWKHWPELLYDNDWGPILP